MNTGLLTLSTKSLRGSRGLAGAACCVVLFACGLFPASARAFTADGTLASHYGLTFPTTQSFEYANRIVLKHDGSALLVGSSQNSSSGGIRVAPLGVGLSSLSSQPQCTATDHDCVMTFSYFDSSSHLVMLKSAAPVGAFLPDGDNGALLIVFDAVFPDNHHQIGFARAVDVISGWFQTFFDQSDFQSPVASVFGSNFTATSAVMSPDGKLFVGGYYNDNLDGHENFFVAGFVKDPSTPLGYVLDGQTGYGNPAVPGFNVDGATNLEIASIALQSDGKIVAVGKAISSTGGTDIAVARLDTLGASDSTFNSYGGEVISLPETSYAQAITIKDTGQIFIAGYYVNAPGTLIKPANTIPLVLRLNMDGSYSGTDVVGYYFGSQFTDEASYFDSVSVQPNGMILLGGLRNSVSSPNKNFLVARVYPDTLNRDQSFGNFGGSFVAFDYYGTKEDIAFTLASNYQGIYVAGRVDESTGPVFGVAALSNHDDIFADGFGVQP